MSFIIENKKILYGCNNHSFRWKRKFMQRKKKSIVDRPLRKKMKLKKVVVSYSIPINVWGCLGMIGVTWLTILFKKIWVLVVRIDKNKKYVRDCFNYRKIKLMSHTMKLWERVIEIRMRKCTSILENRFWFMLGRSMMISIHLMRQMIRVS